MSENYYMYTKSTKHSEKEKRRIELSPFLNSSIYEIITIDSLDLVFYGKCVILEDLELASNVALSIAPGFSCSEQGKKKGELPWFFKITDLIEKCSNHALYALSLLQRENEALLYGQNTILAI